MIEFAISMVAFLACAFLSVGVVIFVRPFDGAPPRWCTPPADPERDLPALLERQFAWSSRTFGEGYRSTALIEHIRRELLEIEADPTDPMEFIDVALLALDGAWRCRKISGELVALLMIQKMAINRARRWGPVSDDKPTEHVRDEA